MTSYSRLCFLAIAKASGLVKCDGAGCRRYHNLQNNVTIFILFVYCFLTRLTANGHFDKFRIITSQQNIPFGLFCVLAVNMDVFRILTSH